jgi:hypothetical protein
MLVADENELPPQSAGQAGMSPSALSHEGAGSLGSSAFVARTTAACARHRTLGATAAHAAPAFEDISAALMALGGAGQACRHRRVSIILSLRRHARSVARVATSVFSGPPWMFGWRSIDGRLDGHRGAGLTRVSVLVRRWIGAHDRAAGRPDLRFAIVATPLALRPMEHAQDAASVTAPLHQLPVCSGGNNAQNLKTPGGRFRSS